MDIARPPLTAQDRDLAGAQLQRILDSRCFSQAPSLRRLIAFLTGELIENRSQDLKEYSIGVEVFARGDSFDPRTDTIVRVQARRLRGKLAEYYSGEGRDDRLRIEIPKGTYVPVLRTNQPDPMPPPALRGPAQSGWPRSLPFLRTSLVGRDEDVAYISQRLGSPDVGLLTLTGPGGSGKTRLAIQVASGLANEFPGGVYYVALAGVTKPDAVEPAIAEVLGIQYGGSPERDNVCHALRDTLQERALLVLDNFEHLLAAAGIVAALLETCRLLKVLVTSRAVLRVYGEHEYPVSPLPLPPSGEDLSLQDLSQNPAIRLFAERAAAASPRFQLNRGNAADVRWICTRLDGLPLAIELAAARVKLFPPRAIRARLQKHLRWLTGGLRAAPSRHQTLASAMDWSYHLLSPNQQRLFRRLAVFSGGFSLDAAEAVAGAWRDLEGDILDNVASLVDHSLLQRLQPAREDQDGEPRFLMLETVRECAFEWLAAEREARTACKAHAAYFLIRAEERQLDRWDDAWLEMCGLEHDNLRSALDWLIHHGPEDWAIRLGLALFAFWDTRELFAEGRFYIESLLQIPSATAPTHARAALLSYCTGLQVSASEAERLNLEFLDIYRQLGDRVGEAGALNALGVSYRALGNLAAGRRYLEEALAVCRELARPTEIAGVLNNLADVVYLLDEPHLAVSLLEEAVTIFTRSGRPSNAGWAVSRLGDVARAAGAFGQAQQHYQEAGRMFAAAGDPWGLARTFADLGSIEIDRGNPAGAAQFFRTALELLEPLDHRRGIAFVLEGIARRAESLGDSETAATLSGAVSSIRKRLGTNWTGFRLDNSLGRTRPQLEPPRDRAAWDRGARLPLTDAVAVAQSSLA